MAGEGARRPKEARSQPPTKPNCLQQGMGGWGAPEWSRQEEAAGAGEGAWRRPEGGGQVAARPQTGSKRLGRCAAGFSGKARPQAGLAVARRGHG